MTNKFTFRATEAHEKAIKSLMTEFDIDQSKAIRKLLDESLNIENKFAFLDSNPCPLRDYLGKDEAPLKKPKGWYCMKKAPALTLLGSGIESAAQKICGKCKIRDGALTDSKLMKEQRTKGIKQRIPHCARGAQLNEAMDEFKCPEIGFFRPIMERKKTTDYKPCRLAGTQNAQCKSLSWSTVTIKGKLPTGQNL